MNLNIFLSFLFLLKIYLFPLYIWVHCDFLQTHQEKASNSTTDGREPPCCCWDLNSGTREEQPMFFTAKPSLQPSCPSSFQYADIYSLHFILVNSKWVCLTKSVRWIYKQVTIPPIVGSDALYKEVYTFEMQYRGRELPGFVNYKTFENIIRRQIKTLEEPAMEMLHKVTGECCTGSHWRMLLLLLAILFLGWGHLRTLSQHEF